MNAQLMAASGKKKTIFMPCLAAHHTNGVHDMEVTEDVFGSADSKLFDEAENRVPTIIDVMVATMT